MYTFHFFDGEEKKISIEERGGGGKNSGSNAIL